MIRHARSRARQPVHGTFQAINARAIPLAVGLNLPELHPHSDVRAKLKREPEADQHIDQLAHFFPVTTT